jgi:hypothetical protein
MIGDRQPLQMKKTPFDVDTDFQRAFDMIRPIFFKSFTERFGSWRMERVDGRAFYFAAGLFKSPHYRCRESQALPHQGISGELADARIALRGGYP